MSKRGKGPWMCSRCGPGGKRWSDPQHIAMHVRHKHGGDGKAARVPKRIDREDSYADRAIDAALDRAMGVHNPDAEWLLP